MEIFKHLAKFDYKRNRQEALGFYIVYLVVFVIVGTIVGTLISRILPIGYEKSAFIRGANIGTVVAILMCLGLSFIIILQKKLYDFKYVLIAVSSGILAVIGGSLLGLIVSAYLTTQDGSKTDSDPSSSDLQKSDKPAKQ